MSLNQQKYNPIGLTRISLLSRRCCWPDRRDLRDSDRLPAEFAQPHLFNSQERVIKIDLLNDGTSVGVRLASEGTAYLIENAFCCLKNFRRITTHYDNLVTNFLSAVALVTAIARWL